MIYRNTALLALLIRMEESTASQVAASAQSIQVVADAYVNGASALEEGWILPWRPWPSSSSPSGGTPT